MEQLFHIAMPDRSDPAPVHCTSLAISKWPNTLFFRYNTNLNRVNKAVFFDVCLFAFGFNYFLIGFVNPNWIYAYCSKKLNALTSF